MDEERNVGGNVMGNLEKIFHQKMLEIYYLAKEDEDCNYTPTRFYQMVNEKGGLATAKALLATQEIQSGLIKLWDCGRLDISMEALVLAARFESLFTEEEREVVRQRLLDYGYEGNEK